MMLPPSPRLRTTTPKHCPSVWTVRWPAIFSVVTTIMRKTLRSNLPISGEVRTPSLTNGLHRGEPSGSSRYLLIVAAAVVQATSSCEPAPAGTADRADQLAVPRREEMPPA